MGKRLIFLTVLMTVLLSQACTNADEIDGLLNKAKKEGKAVMLELGSVGCIPCDAMKPVMAKLSKNYKGKLEVVFIDVNKDRKNAKRFGVYMIPVQVFLDKNGQEFHRHIGFYPYEEIVPVLKKSGL